MNRDRSSNDAGAAPYRAAVLVASLALLLPAAPLLAGVDFTRPTDLPAESRGDLRFHLDLVGFRAEGGRTEEEIYLSLPNDQIVFRGEDGAPAGRLRLEIEIRRETGEVAFETKEMLSPRIESAENAGDRLLQQLVRTSVLLDPGAYHVEVRLVDELSEKPGIIHMIRKTRKKGTVELVLRVPRIPETGIAVSEIAFCRAVEPESGEAGLTRNGLFLDLNPGRQFGLVNPYVSYYSEVYAGNRFAEGDSIFVRTSILDATGVPLLDRIQFAQPKSGAFVVHDEFDLVRTIRAGTYVLEVAAENRRTGESAKSSRPFEVLWAVASWSETPEQLLEEMGLIMRASEFKEFEKLSPGAREVALAEFWAKLDPSPETPENEALLEFRRRIGYADREYAGTLARGLLSDRGRVYVRYVPPDEVAYQYSSSSFGDDGNLEDVSDPSERVGLSNRPATSFLSPDEFREGDVSDLETQRGGTNIRSKQIEVWIYDGPGRTLAGRSSSDRSNRGLKFIFADEMGNGEYELIGSSGTTDF